MSKGKSGIKTNNTSTSTSKSERESKITANATSTSKSKRKRAIKNHRKNRRRSKSGNLRRHSCASSRQGVATSGLRPARHQRTTRMIMMRFEEWYT